MGPHFGYTRVSSVDQNHERQLEGVDVQFEQVFTDKCSGRDTKRPELQRALQHLRAGDTFHVHSIDRLARNLQDLQKLIDDLAGRGISVVFHKENLTFSGTADPMKTLMLQMMGAFAEFERSIIRERQREGIELAKKKGKYKGRKKKLTNEQVIELRRRVASRESKTALAEEFGISRQTLYATLAKAED